MNEYNDNGSNESKGAIEYDTLHIYATTIPFTHYCIITSVRISITALIQCGELSYSWVQGNE